jgi:hypothetical protein
MRKAYLDRLPGDRRRGMRRAAAAAWALVFVLFAFLVVPSLTGMSSARSPSSGQPIERLVARAVPQDSEACLCTQFDKLEMTQASMLC